MMKISLTSRSTNTKLELLTIPMFSVELGQPTLHELIPSWSLLECPVKVELFHKQLQLKHSGDLSTIVNAAQNYSKLAFTYEQLNNQVLMQLVYEQQLTTTVARLYIQKYRGLSVSWLRQHKRLIAIKAKNKKVDQERIFNFFVLNELQEAYLQ